MKIMLTSMALLMTQMAFQSHAIASTPEISNISSSQRSGTKLVDIYYDLASTQNCLTVSVQVSSNGVDYDIPAVNFSGDGYGMWVTPGTGKHIVWHAGLDWSGNVSDSVWFKITADESANTNMEYLVIDLSEGFLADDYPVSFLGGVPPGGWTEEYKTTKLVMRRVPAGSFLMGSVEWELGRSDIDVYESQHLVSLTKDFYVGVFEVSQKQWERVIGNWPSFFHNPAYRDSRPVDYVSYYDIREDPNNIAMSSNWPATAHVHSNSFMGKLRAKTGLGTLDLPTEAQWEYACRAGYNTSLNNGSNITSTTECNVLNGLGRNRYNSGATGEISQSCATNFGTAALGSYIYGGNQWGLFDMHGNMDEWCLDYFGMYSGAETDPKGPTSSAGGRVIRGGGVSAPASACRSASRYGFDPDRRGPGFRLFMTKP